MLIKPPNIKGLTIKEQIKQINDYLFQLSQQLNYIVSILDKGDQK